MNTIKKIWIIFLLTFSIFIISFDYSYAARTIEVIVTEEMPWLDCTPQVRDFGADETWVVQGGFRDAWEGNVNEIARYKCIVPVWMEWALLVLGRMIRWLTGFALVCSVLFLVFNGMRLTTGWVDTEAKWKVKSQIMMTLGGIVLLLLSGPILRLIAPWVYR